MNSTDHPSLYQINTRVWLTKLSKSLNRIATLDDIPDVELARLSRLGFNWVWLLTVWQTEALGQQVSRGNAEWRREFEAVLPDLCEEDIRGSGFAIADYTVDRSLGGNAALERLRARLASHNLKLMLDFVPNHTAIDHYWVKQHPEYYLSGTAAGLSASPQNFIEVELADGTHVFAHGRDPYFDGWPDTLQLDYSNAATRAAMIDQLLKVSHLCDAVRCNMAMLVLPEVFEKTWGKRTLPFWPEAIANVRNRYPNFLFMAEVYWDLESVLQEQGFDYAYDKRLYDRLREGVAQPIKDHLLADLAYQSKLARFLENHDEARAAATFPQRMHEAAAIITFCAPGLRLFHQGQFEGNLKRISPHLVRSPVEQENEVLKSFYDSLLALLRDPCMHHGQWQLLNSNAAWSGNWTYQNFISYLWQDQNKSFIVIVNYAAHRSQCYIRIPALENSQGIFRLKDCMGTADYYREGRELSTNGLYVDMDAFQSHVFQLSEFAATNVEPAFEQLS